MAAHSIDTNQYSPYYDHHTNDTNDLTIWVEQYEEIKNMAYDSADFKSQNELIYQAYDTTQFDTLYPSGHYQNGKVPIGINHLYYHRLRDDVLDSLEISTYFEIDTVDNQLFFNPDFDNPQSVFTKDTLFTVAALNMMKISSAYTFVLDTHWRHTDTVAAKFYQSPDYQYKIDFDDGNGTQYFSTTTRHEINIDYGNDIGLKIVKFELIKKVILEEEDQNPESGMQGAVYIDSLVAGTYFRVRSSAPPTVSTAAQIVSGNGYRVGIYQPCVDDKTDTLTRKVAVIVGGFDPFESRSSEDIWEIVGQDTKIQNLIDFGYEFHVLDFANSKADMRHNADVLISYLDQLKCELIDNGSGEEYRRAMPMVVIGYSMGGVIANYALAKWENEPNVSACNPDYLHYCRLLITMDTPHLGANVPLACQHFYRDLQDLFIGKIITSVGKLTNQELGGTLLDNTAAKQLLMYHVDTKSGSSYGMHPERTEFLSDLNELDNRPQFCKVMAVSCGSARGRNQVRSWDFNPRVAGDRILDFDIEVTTRILFWTKRSRTLSLALNTTNGNNNIYHSSSTFYKHKLIISWRGIKFKPKPTSQSGKTINANVRPYDVASGGYYSGLSINLDEIDQGFNLSPIFHYAIKQQNLGGGNRHVYYGLGLFGTGADVEADIGSDGFGFNFVPTRSALSLGNIYNGPVSPNLEFASPNAVLNNTPFDVVLSVADRFWDLPNNSQKFYNFSHTNLFNPPLLDENYPDDTVRYRSCTLEGLDKGPINYLLNREIGDEKLFLENFNQQFPEAFYDMEYDIYINEPNPAYEYPSTPNFGTRNSAAYSKENPFLQYPCTTRFLSDVSKANSFSGVDNSPGFLYNSPQTGLWFNRDRAWYICCQRQQMRKKYISNTTNNQAEYRGFENDLHHIHWSAKNQEETIYFKLYDLNGRILKNGTWQPNAEGNYLLEKTNNSGLYLLQIQQSNHLETLKILTL